MLLNWLPRSTKQAKKVNPIPKDLHTVTPSLVIAGCAQAIDFYKRAFGAEELDRFMAPDGKAVWHASLKIGDSVVFMNDEMQGMTGPAPGPTGSTSRSRTPSQSSGGTRRRR